MCAQEPNPTDSRASLDLQLALAVQEERYKDAAKIRDRIKALGSGPVPGSANTNRKESPEEIRERLRQREISRFRDIDTGGDNMATPF